MLILVKYIYLFVRIRWEGMGVRRNIKFNTTLLGKMMLKDACGVEEHLV